MNAKIPWYLWASIVGLTSANIGVEWDISWHRSIGRDTFWTPPHMAIHLCGIIAGIVSGYLILATTFGKLAEIRKSSVRMWGFHGPLGAFIMAWGGIAMLVSAPFDDWWHNAYGLDVKILSPPHAALAIGVMAIHLGVLMLLVGYMNRAEGAEQRRLNRLYLYVGTMMLVGLQVMTMEYTFRVQQHTGMFYVAVAIAVPLVMMGVASGSESRWPATSVALVYTGFMLGLIWILPRFGAEPKLGPVFNPVTQFVPPQFPLLIVAPAVMIDVMRRKLNQDRVNLWVQALLCGAAFIGIFWAVQWWFADFLNSPAAANAVFGTIYRDYGSGPGSYEFKNLFVKQEGNFWALMAWAVVVSIAGMRAGLGWGSWMRSVRR